MKLDTAGEVLWQRTSSSPGWYDDVATSTIQTSDGGYMVGGILTSYVLLNYGQSYFDITKLNSTGDKQWDIQYHGNKNDNLYCIQQLPDDGYILGGSSNSDAVYGKTEPCNGSFDYWIIRTNSVGTVLWQKTIGGDNIDNLRYIFPTADNGFLCGGILSELFLHFLQNRN
ncbi:MAG: hypothetical protein IPP29_21915 [Bacteroidetes bacterium]|nr:hypothetical protein [Bacteroidota bacterium]